jgi:acetylglutamate kinase
MVQVDHRLRSNSQVPRYCGDTRITDTETLRIVKEEAGFARCEVESSLSRGFKGTHPTTLRTTAILTASHALGATVSILWLTSLPSFGSPVQAGLV